MLDKVTKNHPAHSIFVIEPVVGNRPPWNLVLGVLMRLQRFATVVALSISLAACGNGTEADTAFGPIMDCTQLPPTAEHATQEVFEVSVSVQESHRVLQYGTYVFDTPEDGALWLFMVRDGICYGFDDMVDEGSPDSRVTTTEMVLNRQFGIMETTRLPRINIVPGDCERDPTVCLDQEAGRYMPLLVVVDEHAERFLLDVATSPTDTVPPMPPGAYRVPIMAGSM